jgi:hypothetical protein
MRRTIKAFASAAIAGGSLLFVGVSATALGQDQPIQSNQPNQPAEVSTRLDRSTGSLALPAGFTQKEARDASSIKSELARVATDGVTKNHFDNLISNFASPDEKRVADAKKMDVTALNNQIDQFNKNWQTKYGRDFKIDNKTVFDDRFMIVQGEVSDPAVAMANWPLQASSSLGNQAIQAAHTEEPGVSANVSTSVNKEEKKAEKQSMLEKGRDVALVRFPTGNGMPDLTVSLLRQMLIEWRVDIPNDRSGQQIYNDLLNRLTYLNNNVSQWPTDINEGYRNVSENIFAALYGVQMSGQGRMTP